MAAKPTPAVVNPAKPKPRRRAKANPVKPKPRRRARRNPAKLPFGKLALGGGVAAALAWAAGEFLPATMAKWSKYLAPAAAALGGLFLAGRSSTRDIAAGLFAGAIVLGVKALMPEGETKKNPGRVHVRANPSSALLTYAPAGSSTYAAQVARGVAL